MVTITFLFYYYNIIPLDNSTKTITDCEIMMSLYAELPTNDLFINLGIIFSIVSNAELFIKCVKYLITISYHRS